MAGLAQAGAALGSAIVPGMGTAIGGALGAIGDTLFGSPSNAQSMPVGPQAAATAVYGSGNLNADNWSVNFRGTQTNTPRVDKNLTATGPTASTASGGGVVPATYGDLGRVAAPAAPLDVPPLALYAIGGLLLWKLFA